MRRVLIDHQLASVALAAEHVPSSTFALIPDASGRVRAYSDSTSDHYPVVSTFALTAQ